MEIVFLGTGGTVPTKDRNTSAIFISYGSEGILVDCGEGTQRQMKLAGIKPTKVTKILITHWHGDHLFGLPGLIATLGLSEYEKTLEIYGPKGTSKNIRNMFNAFVFDTKAKIKLVEVDEGVFFKNKYFKLESKKLKHSILCLGYNFIEQDRRKIRKQKAETLGLKEGPLMGKIQRGLSVVVNGKTINPNDVSYVVKGKKISVIMDTKVCSEAIELAKEADVLICESMYSSKHEEKGEQYAHMTSKQAGFIANQANVKKLVLTHFSQRYKALDELEEDAKTVFDNVVCSYDFMKIKL